MKKPRISYDAHSDVFSIVIKEGYEETHREVSPGVFVELDKNNQMIGIEILDASQNIGKFFRAPTQGVSLSV